MDKKGDTAPLKPKWIRTWFRWARGKRVCVVYDGLGRRRWQYDVYLN